MCLFFVIHKDEDRRLGQRHARRPALVRPNAFPVPSAEVRALPRRALRQVTARPDARVLGVAASVLDARAHGVDALLVVCLGECDVSDLALAPGVGGNLLVVEVGGTTFEEAPVAARAGGDDQSRVAFRILFELRGRDSI